MLIDYHDRVTVDLQSVVRCQISCSVFTLYSFIFPLMLICFFIKFIFSTLCSVVLLFNQEIQAPAYAVYDLPHSVLLGPI